MKTFILITACLLLGCEKRIGDPEIEVAREWLLSEDGQNNAEKNLVTFNQITLDQLVPCETWAIKRAIPSRHSSVVRRDLFVLYAEEKMGDKGRLFVIYSYGGRFGFFPKGYSITESEFKDFGNPVPIEKVNTLNRLIWKNI